MTLRVVIFVAVVTLNFILKALFAGAPPFSYDEIISVKNTLLEFGHVKHEAEWDNNPPFYYYCLWVWHHLIPINEFNSRLLSVIFVSLAVGFAFLFGERFFSRSVGIWTALIMSVSNFLQYYAQEARGYSLILLLSIVSSYLYFLYLDKKKWKPLLLLSIVNFLLIYTHYIAGLIVIFQYLLFWFYGREKRRNYYLVQSLIIVTLILLRFTKGQFLHIVGFDQTNDFWVKKATLSDLSDALIQLLYHPIIAFVIVLVHVAYFGAQLAKFKPINVRDLYLFSVGLGSVLLLFFIGTLKPVFLPRYLIFTVPFFTAFFIHTCIKFRHGGILLVSSILIFLVATIKIVKEPAMDYRSVAEIVSATKSHDDIILINTRDNLGLFLYYFDKDAFLANPVADSACATHGIYGVNETHEIEPIKWIPGSKLFLVQSFHKLGKSDNPVKQKIDDSGRELISTSRFKGVEFSVYARP